ncbi:MAG: ABC transporter ATP-binding protein [Bacteroidetes bacterium]|nr:ABC transporter ATP-binding protein [Bacteroidota bacterium]
MGKNQILEVEDLRIAFGKKEVVKGISFSLERGKTLGIVGESGSGKSVTALSLMGLLPQPGHISGGMIQLNSLSEDDKIISLHEKSLKKVRGSQMAMIFQEPSTFLNPVLACGKQVEEMLTLHSRISGREAREKTLSLFQEAGLSQEKRIYDSFPHQLSGGQKQRLMIAMAIAGKPRILIADEPTTALDVTVQRGILDLLIRLQAENQMSMIFISHDLGVVGEMADDVLVLSNGQQMEFSPVEEIFLSPQNPYTRGLLACRPPLDKKIKRLLTIDDFMDGERNIDFVEESYPAEDESGLPILQVRNLKTWFGKKSFPWQKKSYVKAVDDVSFEIFAGKTLGLVGESGCGKSTLARSVLRLIEPREGRIIFDQKDLGKMGQKELRAERKNMQIIFQDPYSTLNPRIPIGKSLTEPMRIYNIGNSDAEREEMAMKLLDRVELPGTFLSRFPHQLSGGQRQRISIARALSLNPRLIICDEIVSALDVSIQAKILNLLKDLQEVFGLAYLFISHDLSVVRFMSDKVMVMKDGKIVEEGPDIYDSPREAYTQKLLEAIPVGNLEAVQEARSTRLKLKSSFDQIKKG